MKLKWQYWLALILAVAALGAYLPALNLGLYGDDWSFFDLAGRLTFDELLIKNLDPRVQTAAYRPVLGLMWGIEYRVFGNNFFWYHLPLVLFHVANVLILFAILRRVTRHETLAFITGLTFATVPTGSVAVFWPAVVDTHVGIVFLPAIWYWIGHLEKNSRRDYWLAIFFFAVALLIKELAVVLPPILFLVDRLLLARPLRWREFLQRYFWFGVVLLAYAPFEYITLSRSVLISREGYSPSIMGILSNLVEYLARVAFPWGFVAPWSYLGLGAVALSLSWLIIAKKNRGALFIAAVAIILVLPVAPFPFVATRFLYLPMAIFAILFAAATVELWDKLNGIWARISVALAIVAISGLSGSMVHASAQGFAEWARVSRVPFRNIRQAHPTLPAETLLYFFYPPVPGPNLSGMILSHYGPRVYVNATDSNSPARLRDYPLARVYYFDEQGNQFEQRVEKESTARISPALPARFGDAIVLEGYELVRADVKRGDAFLLLLYWRALKPMDRDYSVFAHLLDASGERVAQYESAPRRGNAPTRRWTPGELVVDALQISTASARAANNWRLEIGIVDAATREHLELPDNSDHITIESLRIGE